MLPLHGANRTRHVAIAGVHEACQGGGKVEQECVAAWPSRLRLDLVPLQRVLIRDFAGTRAAMAAGSYPMNRFLLLVTCAFVGILVSSCAQNPHCVVPEPTYGSPLGGPQYGSPPGGYGSPPGGYGPPPGDPQYGSPPGGYGSPGHLPAATDHLPAAPNTGHLRAPREIK
jgi:hypothetical protein